MPAHRRLLRHARADYVALDRNAAHQVAAGHALVHYASNTVYSFIPKNACSTLRVTLAMANGCIAGPEDYAWIHPNNHTFRATLRELVTADYTFVILRCPYARLASVFLDKILDKSYDFWQIYRLLGDQPAHETVTFRSFLALLDQRGLRESNVHWRPQVDFLVYDDYDDWFALEQFRTVPAILREKAGLTVVDARALTRHGTDRMGADASRSFADTPVAELLEMRARGRLPAHAALYDADLIASVRQHYAADLALYRDHFGAADLLFPD
jgi:hypothetical protein